MDHDGYPFKRIVFDTDRQVTRRPLKNKIFLDKTTIPAIALFILI
jgi:hypothetical protein